MSGTPRKVNGAPSPHHGLKMVEKKMIFTRAANKIPSGVSTEGPNPRESNGNP